MLLSERANIITLDVNQFFVQFDLPENAAAADLVLLLRAVQGLGLR